MEDLYWAQISNHGTELEPVYVIDNTIVLNDLEIMDLFTVDCAYFLKINGIFSVGIDDVYHPELDTNSSALVADSNGCMVGHAPDPDAFQIMHERP